MTLILSVAIGVGLNYLPISRGHLIFVFTEFLSGGVF